MWIKSYDQTPLAQNTATVFQKLSVPAFHFWEMTLVTAYNLPIPRV